MLRAGIPPDAHASTSLIRACGEVFQVQRALEYFDSISAEPSSPAMHYGQNRPGGPLAVYNAILDVLVKAGEMTKAMEILEGMRGSRDWKPNLIAYNTVLMGCAYNKQVGVSAVSIAKRFACSGRRDRHADYCGVGSF